MFLSKKNFFPKLMVFFVFAFCFYMLGAYGYRNDSAPIKFARYINERIEGIVNPQAQAQAQAQIELEVRNSTRFNKSLFNAHRKNVFLKTNDNKHLGFLYSDIGFVFEFNVSECNGLHEDFIKYFSINYDIECNRISYENNDFKSHSILIKSNMGRKNLVVYNHGHGGLPNKKEKFAYDFFEKTLEAGSDILVVSMPFVGVDKVFNDFKYLSWDGESLASVEFLKNSSIYHHGVFEMFDTGNSHFIRYFVDSAVVYVLNYAKNYSKINYLGLSGGGNVGIYTCSLLKEFLDNCILVSGVLPLNLRNNTKDFGDAEQITSSLHSKVNIYQLLSDLNKSDVKVNLIYGSNDPCCFDGKSAEYFRKQLAENKINNIGFEVYESTKHAYPVGMVLSILD